jgi:hypothetical protein
MSSQAPPPSSPPTFPPYWIRTHDDPSAELVDINRVEVQMQIHNFLLENGHDVGPFVYRPILKAT